MGESDFRRQLGERVADLRMDARLTQTTVAAAMHVTRTAVGAIEAGTRDVSAYELTLLAAALKTTTSYLLGEPAHWTQERWMELARRNQAARITYEGLAAQEWASNALKILDALKFRYLAEGIGIAQDHQISVSKEPT